MDLNKLSNAEKIIAGSGLALLVFSFFPWFGFGDVGTHNGWDNGFSLLGILAGIAMVAQVGISRFTSVQLPNVGVGWGKVHLGLGIAAAALVLLQVLFGVRVLGISLDREFGAFLGLLAAAGLAYGGFMRSKEPETAAGTAT